MEAHPNVLRCIGGFLELSTGGAVIVTPFCTGGTLLSLLRAPLAIPPAQLVDFARQVAAGLRHMHKHDICHRDVRAVNVFIEQSAAAGWCCKIGDFGLSRGVDAQSVRDSDKPVQKDGYYIMDLSSAPIPFRWYSPEVRGTHCRVDCCSIVSDVCLVWWRAGVDRPFLQTIGCLQLRLGAVGDGHALCR
jgi:serine/threonine protein kinase